MRELTKACTALLLLAAAAGAAARSFKAEGSDTGAGLGPRYVAQGGAGAAASDDVYAIYHNPAGLADAAGFQVSVSRQLNATMHAINFLGASWQLPLGSDSPWRATAAAAYYPRIHARASGAFDEDDFESLFLRYLLPGISGTFDGDIDSKTKSYRVAFGIAPASSRAWSFGMYLERIDCKSNFCGVHATSNGFTTQSTGAKALGVGMGLRWQATPEWTLAASVSDLRTRLSLDTTTTDNAGTRTSSSRAEFPPKLVAAAAWRFAPDAHAAIEYEATHGRYGKSEVDLQMLRLGGEKRSGDWAWRAGALVPVRIRSTESGTLHAPFPFSPTLGLGWAAGPLRVDFALYAHAVMSMHKDRPSPAADLALSLRF